MNKKLFFVVLLLLPITIFSFNFSKKKEQKKEEYSEVLAEQSKKQQTVVLIYNENSLTLPLEDYVVGVVAAEMPASFELEALKAQAIAARTYVLQYLETNDKIGSTTASQVYIDKNAMQAKWQTNFNKYFSKITQAVHSTEGLVIKYNNKLIKSYYYAMSNGYTENSQNVFNESIDYLVSVESKWDANNEKEILFSKEEFCTKLALTCENISITNIKRNESNRVTTLNINGQEFTGIAIRKLLNLRSTDFYISVNENNILIKTKGYGHGVGLSQYGANNMAKLGYHYDEILKYYYQNTEITNL